jgi:hypothetical protein
MKLRALTAGLALLATGTIIGVGTQQFASADVSSGDRPVLVPIESCRLADTRPAFNVGPRTAPLGPAETYSLNTQQAGTECSGDIPATASAIAANVTAPESTGESFITLWAEGSLPNGSTLNPQAGQLVFNAATIDLAADNSFLVYNNANNAHIIIDVIGYYENHDHDDRYYTQTEVDARFGQQKMINIQTMRDHNGETTDSRKGPLSFETSVVLPPDYTSGTDLRLELNYYYSDFTPAACTIGIEENYFEGLRPSTGTLLDDDGGVVTDGIELGTANTITFNGTDSDQIQTLTAVISNPGTIPLAAGDGLNFGLFVSFNTCGAGDVGTHSAAIYYD